MFTLSAGGNQVVLCVAVNDASFGSDTDVSLLAVRYAVFDITMTVI
ncbi:MAG: hypothetical protein AAGA74_01900 [Pseudomonadota bacterium]